ncbi:MAG: hypothetical protein MJ177_01460 [Clostridia bacterium]|nr:hypothetical protein [Clostridia bacterium]
MKKLLPVFLAAVLMLCVCTPAFAAVDKNNMTDYPVVMVTGYSSSQLYKVNPDGSEEHAWGVDFNEIIKKVLDNIVLVGQSFGELTKGNAQKIAKTVGDGMVELYGDLAYDDNGESVEDIRLYCVTPEESNAAVLYEKYPDDIKFQYEPEIAADIAGYIGYENIYNFNVDFRDGTVKCAARLDEFIEDVLKYTGKDKVNIFAVSHGGQTTASYLTLYGYKKQVDNAVLTVPAIGGAALAYDIMSGRAILDEENLLRFVEHGMMFETDYNWLVQAQELGFLDDIIAGLLPYAYKIIGNWGSIWDFIPTDYYEEVKALRLDPEKQAKVIESSDYAHYEVMSQFGTSLQRAVDEYGVNVSIVAGTDNAATTGLQENSDGIIRAKDSTGATTAPFGKRFSDGYTALNGDGSFVSPGRTVDASTAYLPERTWCVDGLFHGMTYKDKYTTELMLDLLLTDRLENVNTDPAFPRFHATTNKSSSVYFEFDQSNPGYLGTKDGALVIRNLSEKFGMSVSAVTARGTDISFKLPLIKILKPGESIVVPFEGEIPDAGKTVIPVTVSYTVFGTVTPAGERTLYFTLTGGKAAEYNPDEPFTDTNVTQADELVTGKLADIMNALGLNKLVSMILNIIRYLIGIYR